MFLNIFYYISWTLSRKIYDHGYVEHTTIKFQCYWPRWISLLLKRPAPHPHFLTHQSKEPLTPVEKSDTNVPLSTHYPSLSNHISWRSRMDLGGLVARNARMLPEKEALVYEGTRLNWREVNERVNAVANTLLKAGLKKGDKVSLWMFNSDLFVLCLLRRRQGGRRGGPGQLPAGPAGGRVYLRQFGLRCRYLRRLLRAGRPGHEGTAQEGQELLFRRTGARSTDLTSLPRCSTPAKRTSQR